MEGLFAYEDKIGEIRCQLYLKQYALANKNINKLLREIKNKQGNKKHELWFCYYSKGYIYFKNGQYDKAFKYAKKSNRCFTTTDEQLKTMWMIVMTRERLNPNNEKLMKKIKRIYLRCAHEYRELKEVRLRISVLYNIAKIDNNKKRMLKLILILKNTDSSTYSNSYKDTSKDALLSSAIKELLELCLKDMDYIMIKEIKKHFKGDEFVMKLLRDSILLK